MNKELKPMMLIGARDAFFAAKRLGYAGKGAKVVKLQNGGRRMTSVHGDFTVIDIWYVTKESDVSFGTTMITFEEQPIWFMQYSGQYQKEAISFLKQALTYAYEDCHFNGGRGPENFTAKDGSMFYENSWSGDFTKFTGHEHIYGKTLKEILGYHHYNGGSML
jgi:hypothetical protein